MGEAVVGFVREVWFCFGRSGGPIWSHQWRAVGPAAAPLQLKFIVFEIRTRRSGGGLQAEISLIRTIGSGPTDS